MLNDSNYPYSALILGSTHDDGDDFVAIRRIDTLLAKLKTQLSANNDTVIETDMKIVIPTSSSSEPEHLNIKGDGDQAHYWVRDNSTSRYLKPWDSRGSGNNNGSGFGYIELKYVNNISSDYPVLIWKSNQAGGTEKMFKRATNPTTSGILPTNETTAEASLTIGNTSNQVNRNKILFVKQIVQWSDNDKMYPTTW